MDIQDCIQHLTQGQHLSTEEASRCFQIILHAGATPAQIASILTAYHLKPPTAEEVIGALQSIYQQRESIDYPGETLILSSTAPPPRGFPNILTNAMLTIASCNIPVIAFGNRSQKSQSSHANILEALGVNVTAPLENFKKTLSEIGIGFVMTPHFFKPMKHLIPICQELGFNTIIERLLAFAPPIKPERMLIAVTSEYEAQMALHMLRYLNVSRAIIFYSADESAMCSLSTTTHLIEWRDGVSNTLALEPHHLALPRIRHEDFTLSPRTTHLQLFKDFIANTPKQHIPFRHATLFCTALALYLTDKVSSMREGVIYASDHVKKLHVREKLYAFANYSHLNT